MTRVIFAATLLALVACHPAPPSTQQDVKVDVACIAAQYATQAACAAAGAPSLDCLAAVVASCPGQDEAVVSDVVHALFGAKQSAGACR